MEAVAHFARSSARNNCLPIVVVLSHQQKRSVLNGRWKNCVWLYACRANWVKALCNFNNIFYTVVSYLRRCGFYKYITAK